MILLFKASMADATECMTPAPKMRKVETYDLGLDASPAYDLSECPTVLDNIDDC